MKRKANKEKIYFKNKIQECDNLIKMLNTYKNKQQSGPTLASRNLTKIPSWAQKSLNTLAKASAVTHEADRADESSSENERKQQEHDNDIVYIPIECDFDVC